MIYTMYSTKDVIQNISVGWSYITYNIAYYVIFLHKGHNITHIFENSKLVICKFKQLFLKTKTKNLISFLLQSYNRQRNIIISVFHKNLTCTIFLFI